MFCENCGAVTCKERERERMFLHILYIIWSTMELWQKVHNILKAIVVTLPQNSEHLIYIKTSVPSFYCANSIRIAMFTQMLGFSFAKKKLYISFGWSKLLHNKPGTGQIKRGFLQISNWWIESQNLSGQRCQLCQQPIASFKLEKSKTNNIKLQRVQELHFQSPVLSGYNLNRITVGRNLGGRLVQPPV